MLVADSWVWSWAMTTTVLQYPGLNSSSKRRYVWPPTACHMSSDSPFSSTFFSLKIIIKLQNIFHILKLTNSTSWRILINLIWIIYNGDLKKHKSKLFLQTSVLLLIPFQWITYVPANKRFCQDFTTQLIINGTNDSKSSSYFRVFKMETDSLNTSFQHVPTQQDCTNYIHVT